MTAVMTSPEAMMSNLMSCNGRGLGIDSPNLHGSTWKTLTSKTRCNDRYQGHLEEDRDIAEELEEDSELSK